MTPQHPDSPPAVRGPVTVRPGPALPLLLLPLLAGLAQGVGAAPADAPAPVDPGAAPGTNRGATGVGSGGPTGVGAGADTGAPAQDGPPPGFSARAMTPSMAFEKAPGVLGLSIRSKRLEGIRSYATEALGLTALGLEDVGLSPVNKTDRMEVNLGERIRFDDKGDRIPPAAHRLLDGIGRVLAENPETGVEIRAHTDDQGDAGFNQRLSQRRADAIRAYLIGRGVDAGRISGVGLGESSPLIPTKGRTPKRSERAKNRRVELILVPREPPAAETAAGPSETESESPSEPPSEPPSETAPASRAAGDAPLDPASAGDGDPEPRSTGAGQ